MPDGESFIGGTIVLTAESGADTGFPCGLRSVSASAAAGDDARSNGYSWGGDII